jgi:transposase
MLFVGDDWAEDHHDIEVQDEGGRRLARARLPEGIAGLTRLHELIAEHLTDDDVDPETGFVAQNVMIGIETDRGTWVSALVAAGYQVFPLNPVQVARYRERHGASGPSPTGGTRTCWPRSCGWTGRTTAPWPATAPRWRG